MNPHAFPSPQSTVLVIVDVQEKLVAAMPEIEIKQAIRKMSLLIQTSKLLGIKTVVSEQYSKGLGKTIQELNNLIRSDSKIYEKTTFSCFGSQNFAAELKNGNIESVIIIGIEAHVCVQQTAFDAIENGFSAFVTADAVCSRNAADKTLALNFMARGGVAITGTESLIFSLIKDSTHPQFRNISKLLK